MRDEIKDILDIFTKYKDDWFSVEYKLKPKQCLILYDYITNLQTIEQQYNAILSENTELTNKITNLEQQLEEATEISSKNIVKVQTLKEENERLNNIIKEVREYVENHSITNMEWWITGKQKIECKFMKDTNPQELLEILDKPISKKSDNDF